MSRQLQTLQQMNLMDRFLFAEAMEDPENLKTVLEIILGREIVLKYLPQTEKEERISPLYRYIRLDVWCQDMDDTIYDAEVQQQDTGNLCKRSRYYQGMIDSKQLEPGEVDFNNLNNVYIIMITPFDLFGQGKYMYTFDMRCKEIPGLRLNDGAVRIFLNTKGKNDDEVSQELIELLNFMEHTDEQTSRNCISERIHEMQKKIDAIKSNEEVSVRFLKEWEALQLERKEARAEGREEGREEGRAEGRAEGREEGELLKLIQQVVKKLLKDKTPIVIAEELEEEKEKIIRICQAARSCTRIRLREDFRELHKKLRKLRERTKI